MSTNEPTRPLVLLADDDIEIRTLVRYALEPLDCDIIEASDGELALEQILIEAPDLVVLDVMMPGLTGWEVCKYIRQRENYDHILILMLTAVGEEVNDLTAPLYGADMHLDKPFDMDEMEATVKTLLAQGRSHKGRAQSASNGDDEE
jgi:DNA-binding response OmpR family regulator